MHQEPARCAAQSSEIESFQGSPATLSGECRIERGVFQVVGTTSFAGFSPLPKVSHTLTIGQRRSSSIQLPSKYFRRMQRDNAIVANRHDHVFPIPNPTFAANRGRKRKPAAIPHRYSKGIHVNNLPQKARFPTILQHARIRHNGNFPAFGLKSQAKHTKIDSQSIRNSHRNHPRLCHKSLETWLLRH